MEIKVILPWPPSCNHYWQRGRRGVMFISRRGQTFRTETILAVRAAPWFRKLKGEIELSILACPPDKRRRDLGNLEKAVGDALEHAGLYDDDYQVSRLVIERGPVCEDGRLEIVARERGG